MTNQWKKCVYLIINRYIVPTFESIQVLSTQFK